GRDAPQEARPLRRHRPRRRSRLRRGLVVLPGQRRRLAHRRPRPTAHPAAPGASGAGPGRGARPVSAYPDRQRAPDAGPGLPAMLYVLAGFALFCLPALPVWVAGAALLRLTRVRLWHLAVAAL